jgi:hypothetical protein
MDITQQEKEMFFKMKLKFVFDASTLDEDLRASNQTFLEFFEGVEEDRVKLEAISFLPINDMNRVLLISILKDDAHSYQVRRRAANELIFRIDDWNTILVTEGLLSPQETNTKFTESVSLNLMLYGAAPWEVLERILESLIGSTLHALLKIFQEGVTTLIDWNAIKDILVCGMEFIYRYGTPSQTSKHIFHYLYIEQLIHPLRKDD